MLIHKIKKKKTFDLGVFSSETITFFCHTKEVTEYHKSNSSKIYLYLTTEKEKNNDSDERNATVNNMINNTYNNTTNSHD